MMVFGEVPRDYDCLNTLNVHFWVKSGPSQMTFSLGMFTCKTVPPKLRSVS